jgi:two-component system CheB/CheR fusion protein
MSERNNEKSFTAQMASKKRAENKGAGIGLLLVKEFLERSGEEWAESMRGEGSSFYLHYQ